MAYGDNQKSFSLVSLASVAAGFAASHFLGPFLFIATIASVLGGLVVSRVRKAASFPTRWAAGLVLGQVGGMIFAVVMQPALLGVAFLDIVVGLVLVVWLLISLSRWPAGLLIAFEVVALVANMRAMSLLSEWNHTMATLLVHILLRLGIIGALVAGWRRGFMAEPLNDHPEDVFT